MQIIIDIPEVMYEGVKLHRVLDTTVDYILNAVENGTVLPKGHGRLIDADSIPYIVEHEYTCNQWITYSYPDIDSAPTIIEAEKGVEK